ncbi:glycosyltransferase family 2 protein [Flavobacterium aquidurense]|uniref:glycosyltransferase family 2 protein n=1 Tax=Flavobacterium aquidurense TaxID=362413 RepID=UPI00285BE94F|nr:glycosyltransferase family 2 protein [Flavobacterium aquidurense]MDR7372330.1 glycosyltransferase involved in cell wall biosynthesis [Flavobacterium aquidurense]
MSKTQASPILTIIIPTYNSGSTLDVALKSIINQTFKNIEILVIDGLSVDNTLEIVESNKMEFPNITVVSEKDNGIYDAMNKGILLAKGTWLYFLGSDDSLYEADTIEKFINSEALRLNEVVYGNVYSERFNGIYDGLFTYSKIMNQNICHQAIFFKKSIFDKIGKFNLIYKSHADWDHNIRWFFSSKISKMFVNQIIANYADGGYSSTHSDEVFWRDKYFLLLTKGIGKLSLSELISCSSHSIKFAKEEKKYLKLLLVLSLRVGLKILKKSKQKFSGI